MITVALLRLTSISSLIFLYLGWSSIASAQSINARTSSPLSDPIPILGYGSKRTQLERRQNLPAANECIFKAKGQRSSLKRCLILSLSNAKNSLKTTSVPTQSKLLTQITPREIAPRAIEPTRPASQPLPESFQGTPATPLTPSDSPQLLPDPSAPSVIEDTILVKRVEVLGSTAFSARELEQVTKPFTGKILTFKQLLALRTAINDLYINNGNRTSGAFLPPQDLANGVIKVQVVEGILEKLEIKGLKHLKESYVRSRLGLAAQPPLDIRKLESALQLLQLDPLFNRVQAELIAGTAPGRNVLLLDLKEARPFASALVVENRDSPSVGSTGVTGVFGYTNLLGLGDRLNAEVGYTEGVRSYNIGYEIPLNSRNGTLSLRYNNGRNSVIEEPFTPLNIRGRSQTYSVGFRQPINRTLNSEFALSLSTDLRRSETFLFKDEPFSFAEGPEDGQSKVTALRFSQDWVNRNQNRVLAARSQFSVGLNILGATVNDTDTNGRFFSWLGQFQWVQALNEKKDFVFVARAAAQLTPNSLLPLEQFSIGGIDTVRGYRTNQRLSDNGVVGSAELRFPVIRDLDGFGLIQLAPFVDIGTVWDNDDALSDSNTLLSTGLGLRWQLGSRFSARLDWGIPLVDVEQQGDSLQDDGLHFSVRWQPF